MNKLAGNSQPVRICEDVQPSDLRRLAANVCLKALDELRARDPVKVLDALAWLTSNDFPVWADAAGLPFADPWQVLTSGRANQRIRTKGKETCKRIASSHYLKA